MRKENSKKVVVAMSGGIDSSVAAALLKRAGFDVIGVFMKFWPQYYSKAEYGAGQNRCCSSESEKRARLVAKKLGIPFYVFNFEKEFKKKVVDYFLKEEKAGLTPNPCVVCNKEIKFGLLIKKVLFLEADYIATGHYARLRREIPNPLDAKRTPRRVASEIRNYRLLKGKDKEKDQSYFLWRLNQKILRKVLFPIGEYTKTKVRELAKKFKLPVLNIPESQEICFIQTTINDFLRKYLKSKPGRIVNTKGKTIGKHLGLYFYTIGQRKGIQLPGGPYYVLDKDIKRNLLIVTQNEKDLYKKELTAKNINWVSGEAPNLPLKVRTKIRYRHTLAQAILKRYKNSRIKIVFSKPQRAITLGQSVVFYKGEEVFGGGIIS